jgi:hypothetical protein
MAPAFAPTPGPCDKPRGNRECLLGIFDIDDPVSGQELLGFREKSIGDVPSFAAGAHGLGVIRLSQPLRGNEHAGIFQFLAERPNEGNICLKFLLRPPGISFKIRLPPIHHQEVFDFFYSLSRDSPRSDETALPTSPILLTPGFSSWQ